MSLVMLSTPNRTDQLPLPLDWEVAPGIPAVPPVPRHLRLVTADPVEVETAPQADAEETPSLAWIARMARAVAEVGCGDRPAGQLTRWVERRQLAHLAARGAAVQRHPSSRGKVTRALTHVRSIRVCPVADGVVETSAVLVGGTRARAIAMRFEFVAERWLVTAISLG